MPTLMRIRDPEVTFLSLCPRGKNRIPVLYKAAPLLGDKGEIEFAALLKDDGLEERGELWAIVYAPGLTDTDGHYATREDVAKMQRSHMRNGGKLDLRHNGQALTPEEAYLAETFLVQKGDARFVGLKTEQGTAIDEEGSWATRIQVEAASLRKEYREGKWGGVSLFGRAFLEPVEKEQGDAREELVQALARVLKMTPEGASPGPKPLEETDMDEATLRRLLAEQSTSLLKEVDTKITTALEPLKPKVAKANEEDPDEPPKFQGSMTNPLHVRRHLAKMQAWEKRQEIDFSDSASVRQHLHTLLGKEHDAEHDDDEIPGFLRDDSIDAQLDAYERRRAPSARSGSRSLRKSREKGMELVRAADQMSAFLNGTDLDDGE